MLLDKRRRRRINQAKVAIRNCSFRGFSCAFISVSTVIRKSMLSNVIGNNNSNTSIDTQTVNTSN